MSTSPNLSRFEALILPHLDAAYNLARWLTGNDQDARDVVQGGQSARLPGVRRLPRRQRTPLAADHRAKHCQGEDAHLDGATPATALCGAEEEERIAGAIAALPGEFREAIVLRHHNGLSYKEIARIAGVPTGTVMSRLARARARLKQLLSLDDQPRAAT